MLSYRRNLLPLFLVLLLSILTEAVAFAAPIRIELVSGFRSHRLQDITREDAPVVLEGEIIIPNDEPIEIIIPARFSGSKQLKILTDDFKTPRQIMRYFDQEVFFGRKIEFFVSKEDFSYSLLFAPKIRWEGLYLAIGDDLINMGELTRYVKSQRSILSWFGKETYVAKAILEFLKVRYKTCFDYLTDQLEINE